MVGEPLLRIDSGPGADGQVALVLVGELDVTTGPRLTDALRAHVAEGCRDLVVDLARVEFMDSSGLAALITACKLLASSGGHFAVRNPSKRVHRVLEIAGLTQLIPILWPPVVVDLTPAAASPPPAEPIDLDDASAAAS